MKEYVLYLALCCALACSCFADSPMGSVDADAAHVRSLTITRTVDGVAAPIFRRECKGDNCPAPQPQPVDPDCLKRKSIIDPAPQPVKQDPAFPWVALLALSGLGLAGGVGYQWRKTYTK